MNAWFACPAKVTELCCWVSSSVSVLPFTTPDMVALLPQEKVVPLNVAVPVTLLPSSVRSACA